MMYPTISEYIEAIRFAEDNFATLTDLRPVLDGDGNPVMSSGNFAVVFKMQDIKTNKLYALKCFTREQEGRADAYRKIANELAKVDTLYIVPIQYLENELFVNTSQSADEEFPLLIMDWVEGITLDNFIRENLDNKDTLALLMSQICRLALWLTKQPFAHGDLKFDNILVRDDGTMILIDYDGMYVPAMHGEKAREYGSPDFRHPLYKEIEFSKHIDDFALAVLVFTIVFANQKQDLFKTLFYENNGLLQEGDFRHFDNSVIYKEASKLLKYRDFARVFSLFRIVLAEKTLDRDTLIFQLESIQHDCDNNLLFSHALKLCNEGKANQADLIQSSYIFKLLKEQNHAESAICYACCLLNGYGCLKQEVKSVILLKEVAEQGYARAQYNLGLRYYYGQGLAQDFVEAVRWYTKSAEQGNSNAQWRLGNCYYLGHGVEQDYSKAVEWYTKAAEQGNVDAQRNLGVCYYFGRGVELDYSKAVEWYTKSAEQGDSNAQWHLGICYALGRGVEQDYSKSVEWYTKSAEQGDSNAQWRLGNCYYFGRGVEQDYPKAVEWYTKAAEQGNAQAQCNLGLCYEKGRGVKVNLQKAKALYQLAKEQHHSEAMTALERVERIIKEQDDTISTKVTDEDLANGEKDEYGAIYSPDGLRLLKGTMDTTYAIHSGTKVICDNAFSDCVWLTTILIPDSVTHIGDSAFLGCNNLTSITIPDLVTHIGDSAFFDCRSLTTITIPASVTHIGDSAFSCCKSLTTITISASVTHIGDSAFSDCRSLTSITIPDSVTHIGDRAFWGCGSLSSITIPDTVTHIGSNAFQGCSRLTTITIPASVTYVGINPLIYSGVGQVKCDSPNFVADDYAIYTKGKKQIISLFNKQIRHFSIPDSVTHIGGSAFQDCYRLTSVTIPNSVTHIGDYAFWNCKNLTSITIPSSVTHIGINPFSYSYRGVCQVKCVSPNFEVDEYALYTKGKKQIISFFNKEIKSFVIPSSVTHIGDKAFWGCDSLTSITIPDSVTHIGINPFNYSGVCQVKCDSPYFEADDNAIYTKGKKQLISFFNKQIRNFTIPDSVTHIGGSAFQGCSSLTRIRLSNSVTQIGNDAFFGCKRLNSISFDNACREKFKKLIPSYLHIILSGYIDISSLPD